MSINCEKKFKLCYPILEKNEKKLCEKINSTYSDDVNLYELRLDYLLKDNSKEKSITDTINNVLSKFPKKEFIATIRSADEGGNVNLSKGDYYTYISSIILETGVDYIDVEYKYYIDDKLRYDNLIDLSKKSVIISKHIFDKEYSKTKVEETLKLLTNTNCDIIKLAVMVSSKDELFHFMESAREIRELVRNDKKGAIFIAMGEYGLLSRLFPEYTGTGVVFINAYDGKSNNLGQVCLDKYKVYRNLLAKIIKN